MTKIKGEEFKNIFKKICEFDRHMGFEFEIKKPGDVIYRLTIKEKHLSSPHQCHGGALAALMDATVGLSALSYAIEREKLCSTIELKTNFLERAFLGDRLRADGKIEYAGNSIIVGSGDIFKDETLIAKSLGTFKMYPSTKMALEKWMD